MVLEFGVISADGRFVAFSSSASNLVIGDTNGVGDVFVHDRLTETTEPVSIGLMWPPNVAAGARVYDAAPLEQRQ